MMQSPGIFLVVAGSGLSILGTLLNNVYLNHRAAMLIWMLSNPLLLIWAVGYGLGLWDGGLSAAALAMMYGFFTVTNWYGLRKKTR